MEQNKEDSKLKKIIAPDVEARKEIRRALNDSAYFIIIGLISMLSIFIPPLFMGCLSSDIGLAFPKTIEGWILYIIMNTSTAIANISLLVLFKLQAKKNARKDPNYIKANEILNKLAGRKEVWVPRSPAKMNAGDYTRKILAIIISTFTASITLTSLILSFDWMTLLSCLISIIITLCVSWITMINNEIYWTEEYILYAEMVAKRAEQNAKINVDELKQNLQVPKEEDIKEC